MNTTPTDDGAFSEKKRFDSSLRGVAEQLGVPLSTVRSWRDDLECPFLQKRPYDVSAVRHWLNEQVRAVIDPNSEIERRKLELEARKLERENRVFSRDKVYWLAVAAAGIAISSEIRQWIKESRATHETDPLRDFASLIRRLGRLTPQASAFKSRVFRSATPHYATETDLLTGEGSRIVGGRWNPPGLAALYASLSPETAIAETLAHARYYELPPQAAMPRTFVAIAFSLKRVLDLTRGSIRRRLAFSKRRMIETDWRAEMAAGTVPLTQALGQAAADIGLEGLLVPSTAEPGGQNIVAFPQNFQTPSGVVVLTPEEL